MDRKEQFQCSYCNIWHDNGDKIIWREGVKGHQYCRVCARKIMDAAIPRKKPRIGRVKMPRCKEEGVKGKCECELSVDVAEEIGATDFQIKILRSKLEAQAAKGGKDKCIVM